MQSADSLNTPPRASRRRAADSAATDDLLLVEHLIRVGRIDAPDNDEWRAELLALIGVARRNLARSEGTFVMGDQYVRLFRVTRTDIVAAAGANSRHRTAGVVDDDPPTAPIVPIRPRAVSHAVHHDFTPRSSIPRGRMPTPADLVPLPSEIAASQARVRVRAQPTTASRIVLGAAAALLVAAVGTVLISAWTPASEPKALTVAQTHTADTSLALPTTTPTAKAADVALARRPAAAYVAPAPKTTARSTSDSARNAGTQAKRRSGPKRRTIPNPIPGLPPIVLP